MPPVVGVLVFPVPFEIDGTKNVLLGIIANWINVSVPISVAVAHWRAGVA